MFITKLQISITSKKYCFRPGFQGLWDRALLLGMADLALIMHTWLTSNSASASEHWDKDMNLTRSTIFTDYF